MKIKSNHSFISFDICEFYPSITETLLDKALNFASKHTNITEQERHIIHHTKKTTLYNKDTPWVKKHTSFDVTMGSFDGAETCELIGLFILSELQGIGVNVGLYRDDGLALSDLTPQNTEKAKKEICRLFKSHDLNITIEANRKNIDFLDITLDLTKNTYHPYRKKDNPIQYIEKNSNHPPAIIKNLPKSINTRISTNSKDENAFKIAQQPYQEALIKSGYKYQMQFDPSTKLPRPEISNRQNETIAEMNDTNTEVNDANTQTTKTRNRKRNITWYNPPYSANVSTNIGKHFLSLIDSCFPKGHKLRKIINRNTIKVSYSCMPNIKQSISNHNKKLLSKQPTENNKVERNCNCRDKNTCPLQGECLKACVIYQGTTTNTTTGNKDTYIGLTENTFKTRYTQHKSSFKLNHKRSSTALSEHIWSLSEKHMTYTLDWEILAHCRPYKPGQKFCALCVEEKFLINKLNPSLNVNRTYWTYCAHKRKFLLEHNKIGAEQPRDECGQ